MAGGEDGIREQRGWGQQRVERLPPQPLPESLLGLCKIKKYLPPVLGFTFPSVSLKVPLTRHPRKVGILQGEFLCTEH